MMASSCLFPIPLTFIPLPFPGLQNEETAGKKMGAKKSPAFIFCPHLFAFSS